jgi:hypothetical protein
VAALSLYGASAIAMAVISLLIDKRLDAGACACNIAVASAVRRTLQRGVAITVLLRAVTAGPSIRELWFSGPAGNLNV